MPSVEQVNVIVNIWAILIGALVTVAAVLITAFYNQRLLIYDRRATEAQRRRSALHSILVEIQAVLEFARKPWNSRMLWMPNDMWRSNRDAIYSLPQNIQDEMTRFYLEVEQVNSIITSDTHKVAWGHGYLDLAYQQQCAVVVTRGEQIRTMLDAWLRNNNRGQSKKKVK
ncbi:MAG: hypothetical protein Q7T57_00325 [Dehalococcoidales bacterium]|nr:hypothetical protein [Dehalococcoidales bacterium]